MYIAHQLEEITPILTLLMFKIFFGYCKPITSNSFHMIIEKNSQFNRVIQNNLQQINYYRISLQAIPKEKHNSLYTCDSKNHYIISRGKLKCKDYETDYRLFG